MPRPKEIEYWNRVSQVTVRDGALRADNVWKRPHQIRRLLEYSWQDQVVLEIGTGNGVVAAALQISCETLWKYIGTELSEHFRAFAKAAFQLQTIEADVTELPAGPFTRIIALDSLEHVHPDMREDGYARIAAVAATDALLFIHYSHSQSYHDTNFDHPFGLNDIVRLEQMGFALQRYERYVCGHPNGDLDYSFVVMKK